MSDSQNAGFGKFVPGFDFLQSLAKGATETIPQMPNLANWIAPTLNLEDLEKRISELKAVHFWLDQNSKALGATVQALEVQKMTLAALKGMNFNVGEMAQALKPKATESPYADLHATREKEAPAAPPPARETPAQAKDTDEKMRTAAAGLVDPIQLWGALTQQFQQIATSAMKDVAQSKAMDVAKGMAAGFAPDAAKTAKKAPAKADKPRARAPAKKSASKAVSRKG